MALVARFMVPGSDISESGARAARLHVAGARHGIVAAGAADGAVVADALAAHAAAPLAFDDARRHVRAVHGAVWPDTNSAAIHVVAGVVARGPADDPAIVGV